MTKTEAKKNVGGNTIFDRIAQGAALFTLIALATGFIYERVNAAGPEVRLFLATLPILGLLFLIITPFFRRAA